MRFADAEALIMTAVYCAEAVRNAMMQLLGFIAYKYGLLFRLYPICL